jgi:hypothetical protein
MVYHSRSLSIIVPEKFSLQARDIYLLYRRGGLVKLQLFLEGGINELEIILHANYCLFNF